VKKGQILYTDSLVLDTFFFISLRKTLELTKKKQDLKKLSPVSFIWYT